MAGQRLSCPCGHWIQVPKETGTGGPSGALASQYYGATSLRGSDAVKDAPATKSSKPVKKPPEVKLAVGFFVVGVIFIFVAVSLYKDLDRMEQFGGVVRGRSVVKMLYKIGGKGLVALVFGGFSIGFFIAGIVKLTQGKGSGGKLPK